MRNYGEAAEELIPDAVRLLQRSYPLGPAAETLAHLGEKGVLRLVKMLPKVKDQKRQAVTEGLLELDPKWADLAMPYVCQSLRSTKPDWYTRNIVAFLGRMGKAGSPAIPELLPLLTCRSVYRLREEVTRVLEKLGAELVDHVKALEKLLREKEPRVSVAGVCRVLAAVTKHTETAYAPLAKAMKSAKPSTNSYTNAINTDIRHAVARGLGNLGSTAAKSVPDLLPMLHEKGKDVRRDVCQTLGQIGSEEACAALRRACRDGEEAVRVRAVEALGRIGKADDEVIESVVLALDDDSARVRREAVTALSRLGDARDSVRKALKASESDPDSKVRTLATRAVKKLS